MVIPRSRSALSLSRTQAYLKEPLPSSAASYCRMVSDCLTRDDALIEIVEWERAKTRRSSGGVDAPPKKLRSYRKIFGLERGSGHVSSRRKKSMNKGRAIEGSVTNLLELLDGSLVDTTALVDQVTGL